jgi:hypothetical protein
VAAGGLKVQLLDASYTYDPLDIYITDIASGDKRGALTTVAGTIAATTVSGRPAITTDASTVISSVAVASDVITALAVTFDDGTGDRLLAITSRRSDRTSIAVVATGGDVTVSFGGGVILKG